MLYIQPRGGKAEIDGGTGEREIWGLASFRAWGRSRLFPGDSEVPSVNPTRQVRGACSLVLFIFQDKDRLDLG